MLAAASALVATLVPSLNAAAQDQVQLAQAGVQSTPTPASDSRGKAITPNISASAPETIIFKAQRRLLKERNSPSAVTELGAAQIATAGVAGSPATLLRQAPSVYVYQQGLGDNAPEVTVRGLRGLEIASTLDGVPTQDLLAPGSFYLANNLGGVFTLGQISGVHLYPGVASPDKNTFGTIGGTIGYDSKRPTNDRYLDITGSIGSFGTYKEGFEFNTGRIDSPLGTGDNAIKATISYNNFQSQGFIDGTPIRENEVYGAFDKPYTDGLSDFQGTFIYNTANGLIQNEPVPTPYLNRFGGFSNYPTNLTFAHEQNDYGTIILKNDTYVNDTIPVLGVTAFYIHNDQQLETYGDPSLFLPGGQAGRLTVGGSSPFINNPAGFGEGGLYGPPGGGDPFGIFGSGYGGYFYGAGNRYNPSKYYNNPKACPPAIINAYGGAGFSPCGLNDQITGSSSDSYGIQPHATLALPEILGIANTVKLGALIAKETQPQGYGYLGAFANTPLTQANSYIERSGGTQRTIYQAYIQDKIDVLDNTLHITPGATLEGTSSSFIGGAIFGSKRAPINGPNGLNNGGTLIDQYGPYQATKWDREFLPFFNISYDLDKILPALRGTSFYGSVANSALFAPVTDFGPNNAGPPPYASTVHMYEVGARYNVTNLTADIDYFYQKVDRDFGFFQFQSGPQNGQSVYSGSGQREFKGFEAKTTWRITPEWQLFGNVSHILAKYLQTSNEFVTVAQDQFGFGARGTSISGVPDWLSTFGVDYSHRSLFRDGDAFDARLSGTYTGKQSTTFDLNGGAFLHVANFQGLEPLDFNGCPGAAYAGTTGTCRAYTRYNQITGATTTDTKSGGISPFAVFDLDLSYTVPTPQLPALKRLTFDVNIQNLFNQRFFQYFYKQISPTSCSSFGGQGQYFNDPATGQPGKTNPGPGQGPVQQLRPNNYSCSPQFSDAIPGQPFSIIFTVTGRF